MIKVLESIVEMVFTIINAVLAFLFDNRVPTRFTRAIKRYCGIYWYHGMVCRWHQRNAPKLTYPYVPHDWRR